MTDSRAGHGGRLLGIATVAVAFAAADTYVVVLALPAMMASAGLSIDQLQRAAPVISGFLLGYVAMLPLIGRVADLRGRLPVLSASLLVFAFGSLVTAASYDLGSLVAGRFLQGVGGGGLVPVTLALVADLYPAERRGLPLGVVGAVQELGSVLGPVYGAGVLVVGSWRDIFLINLVVGLALAIAVAATRTPRPGHGPERRRLDVVGALLGALTLAAGLLVMRQPEALVTSVRWGTPFVPFTAGGSIWWSPLGLAAIVLAVATMLWELLSPRAVLDVAGWRASLAEADLPGSALLAVSLGGVIVAFATADPQVQVFSPAGPWALAVAVVAAVAFWRHNRRARRGLIPSGSLSRRPAWGAVLVSFFTGAALIAALVDVPIFARLTVYADSQIKAALVLVELLVAIPIGAVAGGFLVRRVPTGVVTAAGMACAAVGNWLLSQWGDQALAQHATAALVLGLTGLGFGLALAPVNAALLASTDAAVHGVTSALLVVARMIGMLVGISALTTIGLRRYYDVQAHFPSPQQVCGGTDTRCKAYTALLEHAGIEQLQAIFLGAALCALIAGLIAVLTLGRAGSGTAATSATLLRTVT